MFSEVYLVTLYNAEKNSHTRESKRWSHETSIFLTAHMKHVPRIPPQSKRHGPFAREKRSKLC